MDLTALLVAMMMLVGSIGVDTILNPRSLIIEAYAATSDLGPFHVTDKMLTDAMEEQVAKIALTPSIVAKPTVRLDPTPGVGVAIADSLGVGAVATAIQAQVGYNADRISLYLFTEGTAVKAAVSGADIHTRRRFLRKTELGEGEGIIDLVTRATEMGMEQVEPYLTALYLMHEGLKTRDFRRSLEVITASKARLRPDRDHVRLSLLVNLEGMIALLRADPKMALELFQTAVATDPTSEVATLNLAIMLIANGQGAKALAMLESKLRNHPPSDGTLLALIYAALGAAQSKERDWASAEVSFSRAAAGNPTIAATYAHWAAAKRAQGDLAGAEAMEAKARTASGAFVDYAEVIGLYFVTHAFGDVPNLYDPYRPRPSNGASAK